MKVLHHSGVIKFIETYETLTHLYIIAELFDGIELQKYL